MGEDLHHVLRRYGAAEGQQGGSLFVALSGTVMVFQEAATQFLGLFQRFLLRQIALLGQFLVSQQAAQFASGLQSHDRQGLEAGIDGIGIFI